MTPSIGHIPLAELSSEYNNFAARFLAGIVERA
jgi:hypothetical protein